MKKSNLSAFKKGKLLEFFTFEVTARNAAKILDINHSKEFTIKSNHIKPSENFWSQAKRIARKFNGIPGENFHLILCECEWKFNNPSAKI